MLNSFVFFPVRDSWVVRIFEILLSKWKYFFMICVDSGVGSNSSFWWAATSLFWGAVSSLFSTFSSLLLNFWFSGSLFSCFISTLVSVILWSLVLLICFSCSCFGSEKLFEAGSGFIVVSFLISILSDILRWDFFSWDFLRCRSCLFRGFSRCKRFVVWSDYIFWSLKFWDFFFYFRNFCFWF